MDMPSRTREENDAMRKWIIAALKAGEDSPRSVQEWIGQNSDIEAPSIPTIAKAMREQGWRPVGFKWEKVQK
jgi:hypothetical protein